MSVRRKWHFRIEHILEAIAKIQRYTAGMSEEAFTADDLVWCVRQMVSYQELPGHV